MKILFFLCFCPYLVLLGTAPSDRCAYKFIRRTPVQARWSLRLSIYYMLDASMLAMLLLGVTLSNNRKSANLMYGDDVHVSAFTSAKWQSSWSLDRLVSQCVEKVDVEHSRRSMWDFLVCKMYDCLLEMAPLLSMATIDASLVPVSESVVTHCCHCGCGTRKPVRIATSTQLYV